MFNRTRVRSPILVHMNTVNPIPAGYRTITPYLAVPDGHAALDYYKRALGAEIVDAMNAPDGSLMHAEIRIGDSMLQLSQEMPDFGLKSPQDGWVHSSIVVYTEDTDEFVARAVAEEARWSRLWPIHFRATGMECFSIRSATGGQYARRSRMYLPKRSLAGRGRFSFRRRSRHSNLWQPSSEHSSFGGVLSIRLRGGPRGQPAPHPSRSGSRSWRRDPRRRRGERLADWNRGV